MGKKKEIDQNYEAASAIAVFSAGQYLYDNTIYMLPTVKDKNSFLYELQKAGDYIFPIAVQMAFNSYVYPNEYKKLILEIAEIYITISTTRALIAR